jgi:hypothetical protein
MEQMKAAQVVDTIDVIGVGVGEKNCINMGNGLCECLSSKVGRGVDQDEFPRSFYQDRSTGSGILRVGGGTDRALAPDHRNAGGRSAAENRYLHAHPLWVGQ